MNNKISTLLVVIVILVLNIVAYHRWFFGNNILTSGDWGYAYPESIRELFVIPQTWTANSNIGSINLGLTFAPKFILNGLLAKFNVSTQLNSQITYLWPIVIFSALGYFFLGKKVVGSNIAGFFSSIFFSFNVITIAIRSGHLTIASAHALVPFVLLSLIKTFENKKVKDAIFTGILCYLVSFNEVRIFYLIAWIIGLLFLYDTFIIGIWRKNLMRNIFLTTIVFGLAGLLNFYWMIAFANISYEPSSGFSFLGRQIFGSGNYNILNSFTAWNIWWTGGKQASAVQSIPLYFWLIPLTSIIGLFFNRKNKLVVFFGLITLIGLFLGKQEAIPFTKVYSWLYHYLPGFSAFREASKFYIFILTGYSILIGSFADWIWNHKTKILSLMRYPILISIFLFLIINAKPLVTGEIGSIFVPRYIPSEYLVLKNFLLSEPEYFKTMWIPTTSRWGFFSDLHPSLNFVELINNDWDYIAQDYVRNHTRLTDQDVLLDTINKFQFANLLNISSVKYVVIPLIDKSNDDNFYDTYGSRAKYITALNNLNYLKKVNEDFKEILIYENIHYHPHLYFTDKVESLDENLPYSNITYKRINATQYKVEVKNLKYKAYLNFSERYHPDWKITPKKFNWWQSLIDKNYFISNNYHFSNGARMNSFAIDPGYIKSKFSKEDYVINADGSLDLYLTIYFKPQAYLDLGLIISVSTLIFGVGYIIL